MKKLSVKLLRKNLYLLAFTSFICLSSPKVIAQTKTKADPNLKVRNGQVQVNPSGSIETNIPLGGTDEQNENQPNDEDKSQQQGIEIESDDDAYVKPSVGLRNNEVNADVRGKYNPDINIGGQDRGVRVNPNVRVRNGDLSIDPEFDFQSAIEYGKNQVIDFAKNALFKTLGVDNFLTQLQQDFQAITGDITTFLGLRGAEPQKGQAGIPNIQEAEVTFTTVEDLDPMSDILGTQTGTTFGNTDKLMQRYLSDLSQEISENNALSLRGQSIVTGNIETANSIAQKSNAIAIDSSEQDVSQNILRNKSLQDDLRLQLDTMSYIDRQEAKIGDALSMQMSVQQMNESSKTNVSNGRKDQALNSAATNGVGLIYIPTPDSVEAD